MPSDIWAVRKGPTGPELPTVALGDVPGASGAEFSAHPYLLNPYLVATDFLGAQPRSEGYVVLLGEEGTGPSESPSEFCFRFCAEAAQRICVVCV